MRRFYTNPDTGTEVTLEGVQVRATTRDGQHAWRVNPGGRGSVWLLTNGAGDVLDGRPEASGQLLTDLRTTYHLASSYAVPVRSANRRQLRSLAFDVAAQDGLTARDVARELAEMFGWTVTDHHLDAETRAAALELGIDLPAPAEDNTPGLPETDRERLTRYADAGDTMAARELEQLPAPEVEAITCADVAPGDYVSRLKRGPYHQVTDVTWGASSAWLVFAGAPRIRPHRSAKLWRQVRTEVSA